MEYLAGVDYEIYSINILYVLNMEYVAGVEQHFYREEPYGGSAHPQHTPQPFQVLKPA
jgi:hypothetical protein